MVRADDADAGGAGPPGLEQLPVRPEVADPPTDDRCPVVVEDRLTHVQRAVRRARDRQAMAPRPERGRPEFPLDRQLPLAWRREVWCQRGDDRAPTWLPVGVGGVD